MQGSPERKVPVMRAPAPPSRLAKVVLWSLLLIPPLSGQAPSPPVEPDTLPLHSLAGEGAHGILEFSISEEGKGPIPGRLTFCGDHAPGADLFPNIAAAPLELAVRKDIVYSLSGRGRITVPVGTYTVHASHGLEYSIDTHVVEITDGGTARLDATLVHEIDSTGWISADFHLHTLTYSGHGDSNLEERIISIVGEGLEVAVSTDHNHHTDYSPTISRLGVSPRLFSVVGNEVSTPIGHFNVFPAAPGGPLLPSRAVHAPTLFSAFRAHDSKTGARSVIQVNHPRWLGIDYFAKTGLDPVSGLSESPNYSRKFDSIEVLNENACWGYYETGVDPVFTGSSRHSVLEDWFSLLDLGQTPAAVGNSDSHAVRACIAGVPRNFCLTPSEDPGEFDPRWLVDAVRGKRMFTTTGPFVEFTINGAPVGSRVTAGDPGLPPGAVELGLAVSAASWIDVDRVIVVVNGDRALTIPVPEARTVERLRVERTLSLPGDAWIVVIVEGDDPMAPVIPDTKRPIRPLALTNPIWVDTDRDGLWLPPRAAALRSLEELESTPARALPIWRQASDANRRRLLLEARPEQPFTRELALAGLGDPVRRVRLAACLLADRLGDASLDDAIVAALRAHPEDPYLSLRGLLAIEATETRRSLLLDQLDARGLGVLEEGRALLADDLPGDFVRRWRVIGYLDPAEAGSPPPPTDARKVGKRGEIGWEVRETRSSGYLDLLGLDADPIAAEEAMVLAEVWLHSAEDRSAQDRRVLATLGADDSSRVFLDGVELFRHDGTQAAKPDAHLLRLPLHAGWNRLVVEIRNGRGAYGAYLRILDDRVRVELRPDSSS